MILSLLLAACDTTAEPVDRTPIQLVAGSPVAGMAAGVLDLPVGAPLGGYSARCGYLGGASKIDDRKTPYTVGFVPSVGVHTPTRAQVLWLENGDQHLVLSRFDAIYSSDAIVDELEARLSQATGIDLEGRVVVATSHSHHAVADFTPQEGFYLGGDRHDEEVFQRVVGGLEALALDAYDTRVDAAIGVGTLQDWDPDDRVYRDRRGENNELGFFDDIPDGPYKDPNLWLLRVDTAAGEPMGFFFTFGMHGTSLGEDNPLQSTDSIGGVEQALRDRFDSELVIAHLQGGGGDASPAGSDDGLARLETIGEYAADAIIGLWEDTVTSTVPVTLEAASRGVDLSRELISIDRPYGQLEYAPLSDDPDYSPDNIIYGDSGEILSPIDEFNAPYGGVFCGYDDPLLSSGTIGADVFPYDGCMDIELISGLIYGIFQMDQDDLILPMPHMLRALTTGVHLGPVAITDAASGETVEDELLLSFFPGETTALYSEQFRRRALDEVGFEHAFPVGYAQDHEGYLLIPEDWLVGGYEPNITFWGPLGAEHILQGNLQLAEEVLSTSLLEPQDPLDLYPSTTYPDHPLGTEQPDTTPEAGTLATAVPDGLWTPTLEHGLEVELGPAAQVARVQGVVQLVWQGGDPMVDSPRVLLEKQVGGTWEPVTNPAGTPISSDRTDILTAWLPDPLYPSDATQTHTWWAGWQAVSWGGDRAGLDLGTYRLRVEGERYTGGSTTWPWASEPYEVASESFEVVEAPVSLALGQDTVDAAIVAPAWGWRLVNLEGSSRGSNPLVDPVLSWELGDGSLVDSTASATSVGGVSRFEGATAPPDAVAAVVVDAYGNTGRVELP